MKEKNLKAGEYEIIKEGKDEVMKINFVGMSSSPSIEYDGSTMASIIERIIEVPSVTRIIISAERNYQYGPNQIQYLREIANVYTFLTKQLLYIDIL